MNSWFRISVLLSLSGLLSMASMAVVAGESGSNSEHQAWDGERVSGWRVQSEETFEIPYGEACDPHVTVDKGEGLGLSGRFSTGPAVQLPAEIKGSSDPSHYEIVVERHFDHKNNKNLDVSISGSIPFRGC